jgi:hypothetical protein
MMNLEMDERETARAISVVRFGVGVACFLWPRRVARIWLGDDAAANLPMAVRGVGARDIAIAVGTINALDDDGDVSAWLRAGATADAADATASLMAFGSLRGLRRWIWPLTAGAAAFLGLSLAGELE